MANVTAWNTTSEIVFQRNGKLLVTPGENRPEVSAAVRLCAQLEAISAGSYLFQLSNVAIWGSAARGLGAEAILGSLELHAATPVPAPTASQIFQNYDQFGSIWIEREASGSARILARDPTTLTSLGITLGAELSNAELATMKLRLATAGWPVVDRSECDSGDDFRVGLSPGTSLRRYQAEAVEAHLTARNGLVLLPCGAGKTVVGVGAICAASASTLILTPSREIALQWERTILGMTSAERSDIATLPTETPGRITISTYQAASRGRIQPALVARPWGLVIYDEVQSLPANVFRTVSAISAARRLGLSATLVREDGREAEIFAMVGPVIYDLPWVELEREGWIAPARCFEVRIPPAESTRERSRFKHAVVERLVASNEGRPMLIVGSHVASLAAIAKRFDFPLLTGKDGPSRRSELFEAFRRGDISRLAVSRIGSIGLDLPSAEVMIQVNGNFGSRQEEAQRLGRLLRPGNGKTVDFFSLVSLGTRETEYARRRQRFLVDQGYEYGIVDAADLPRVDRA